MPALRLIARFFALMFVVLSLSLGLAWAWDRSDAVAATPPAASAEPQAPGVN